MLLIKKIIFIICMSVLLGGCGSNASLKGDFNETELKIDSLSVSAFIKAIKNDSAAMHVELDKSQHNPFAPIRTFKIGLNKSDTLKVELYNVVGNGCVIFQRYVNQGSYFIDLKRFFLYGGVYFIKITLNGKTQIKNLYV